MEQNSGNKVDNYESKKLDNFYSLIERIKKLVTLLHILTKKNRELQKDFNDFKLKQANSNQDVLIEALETELKNLKLENKILKEKEKAIKTKIDRLAVKLNQIHL